MSGRDYALEDECQRDEDRRRQDNAQERAWLHSAAEVQSDGRRVELLTIIRDQYRLAKPGPPPCACCGHALEWHRLYRCYDCDLWLCPACSRAHFGARPGLRASQLTPREAATKTK